MNGEDDRVDGPTNLATRAGIAMFLRRTWWYVVCAAGTALYLWLAWQVCVWTVTP